MRKNSTFAEMLFQRVAGGGIASGTAEGMGFQGRTEPAKASVGLDGVRSRYHVAPHM